VYKISNLEIVCIKLIIFILFYGIGEDKGSEMLLSKYLCHFVKCACQVIKLANHVASRSSKHYQIITKVISANGFGTYIYIL
jgi:hypothetical protein